MSGFGPPADWLRLHYGASPEEFRPIKTRGYWERIEPCGGRAGGCRNMIHTVISCEGPVRHTVCYVDPPRDDTTGRWASPYITWETARAAYIAQEGGQG